jgi:hypothetical protein
VSSLVFFPCLLVWVVSRGIPRDTRDFIICAVALPIAYFCWRAWQRFLRRDTRYVVIGAQSLYVRDADVRLLIPWSEIPDERNEQVVLWLIEETTKLSRKGGVFDEVAEQEEFRKELRERWQRWKPEHAGPPVQQPGQRASQSGAKT